MTKLLLAILATSACVLLAGTSETVPASSGQTAQSHTAANTISVADAPDTDVQDSDQASASASLELGGVDSGRIAELESQVYVLQVKVSDLEQQVADLAAFKARALAYQARIESWMETYRAWHKRAYGAARAPESVETSLGIRLAPGETLVSIESDLGLEYSSGSVCVDGRCYTPRRGIFRRRR